MTLLLKHKKHIHMFLLFLGQVDSYLLMIVNRDLIKNFTNELHLKMIYIVIRLKKT